MGLAPNIPLAVQPPTQGPGPLDLASKSLNVQALINAVQRQKTEEATAQLQQQQEQIKTQQMQQQQQDLNTIREMAPKYAGKDANGNGTFDFDGLTTEARQRGVNPMLLDNLRMEHYKMVEAQAKAGSESLANEQAHNKASYEVMESTRGIDDPQERQTAWSTGLNKLKLLGMDTTHLPQAAPDDKALSAYETPLGMHGQQIADAKTLAETNEKNATAAEKEWQKFPELGVLVNTKSKEVRSILPGGPVPSQAMLENRWLTIDQNQKLGQPISAADKAFKDSYKDFKEIVPQFNLSVANNTGIGKPAADVAKQFGLTPEAFDQAAEKYYQTGTLPQMARNAQGMALQRALQNRTAELHAGASLAEGSAEFKANSDSLKKIQGNLDAVSAFENTANKNLDLFTGLAQKAINTGIPLTNAPLRTGAKLLFGSEDQLALDAARQVAVNEIAKVTSSPGLTGQLSDSARHEIEAFIPANATYGQALRVAQVLKQDMANRHQSYQEQIADIKKRMGGANQNPTVSPSKPDAATHTGIGSIDKKKHWLDKNGNDLGLAE